MNEKIYRSARSQYVLMWIATLVTPVLFGLLWTWLAAFFSSSKPGFWLGAGAGILAAAVVHLALRKLLRNVYLYGSAIYESYRRERKESRREARRRKAAESFEAGRSDLSA